MAFNGHKNWNHWNVSLWLHNDEGLYRIMRRSYWYGRSTKTSAAKAMLEELNERGMTHTPDGAPYTASAIRAAMVDW